MQEIAIIEIDALLVLINSTRLTENEIIRLKKADFDPIDLNGYYATTAQLLSYRSVYDTSAKQHSKLLIDIAKTDNIELKQPILSTPEVNIPFFAGGL